MELVINEQPKIKITYNGQTYEIDQPTVAIQMELQDKLEECKKLNIAPFKAMVEWAMALGMPKEVTMKLSLKTFQDIIEFVSDTSKKK